MAAVAMLAAPWHVAAASPPAASPATPPHCGKQPNLNYPTNSNAPVLTGYWFAIRHHGAVTTTCRLGDKVQNGDVVTAHFSFVSNPVQTGIGETEVTLASYATADPNARNQTLYQCASYSTGSDPDPDACSVSTTTQLTVAIPPCGFQVDFVYAEPLLNLTKGDYVNEHRFISGAVKEPINCGGAPVPEMPWAALAVGGGGAALLVAAIRRTWRRRAATT